MQTTSKEESGYSIPLFWIVVKQFRQMLKSQQTPNEYLYYKRRILKNEKKYFGIISVNSFSYHIIYKLIMHRQHLEMVLIMIVLIMLNGLKRKQ